MAQYHALPLTPPRLSGTARVGQKLHLMTPDWGKNCENLCITWYRNGKEISSGPAPVHAEISLQDIDDGQEIHAMLTAQQGAETLQAATDPMRVATQGPRVRPLVFDDVLEQDSGLQQIPVGNVFEGLALRYRVLRGDAEIDTKTGMLQVPTDRGRDSGRITIEGRNSGGATLYNVQYAVEGDDTRAELTTTAQLEVDGVSFIFDRPSETGHFITGAMGAGDPFVVGPVTLLSYTPAPVVRNGRAMNGAMLNPPCSDHSGFDSIARDRTYQERRNVGLQLPLTLLPGDSLIVTISNPEAQKPDQAAQHFVVLTCVAEPPYADSFRPPYSGRDRPIWRASQLDPGRLARLAQAGRAAAPDKNALIDRFGRFALEISRNWNREHLRGKNHAPLYGRDLCGNESAPYVWVNSDVPFAEKEQILHGLIQRGIDRYGVFRSAREQGFQPWEADGAHHSGRKFSIMFAGHMLNDDAMRHVSRQSAGEDGVTPSAFQEDAMTFHVTPEIVRVSQSDAWRPPYRNDADRPKQPYTEAMVGIPDWRGKPKDIHVNAAWTGHPYRIAGNHNAQHGQVLAALAMGLQEAWDHDAYFDYHIRFMEIMDGRHDPWQFQGGEQALYNPVEGSRQRGRFDEWKIYWRDPWAWHMLMRYRFDFYKYPWA